jgi:hypothetical protein
LFSWFRRKVTVGQAHPTSPNVHQIRIDPADGSEPQELLVKTNDLFSLAWVCREFQVLEKQRGGPAKDIRLTLAVPLPANEEEIHNLTIPDWARSKLFAEINRYAKSIGWKGEVFQPSPTAWKRLLEDNFDL